MSGAFFLGGAMADFLFTEEEIRSRFEDFFDVADKFCEAYNVDQEVEVEIDPSLLYLAVVAIYDDIARYKAYHLTNPFQKKSNPVKRAAYAVKWLMHFSPLVFPKMAHVTGGYKPENADTLANAMFAIHFAMINLRVHTGVNFDLNRELKFEIMYDLFYRGLTTDSLILLFDIVCSLASTGSVDPVVEI